MAVRKCLVLCCVLAISGAGMLAQQREGSGTQGGDKAMEAWMMAATPGAHHQHLGKYVGSWTYEGKMWLQPGQEGTPMTGTMEARWVLDGRWVQTEVEGSMMGMPMTGLALDGYDNIKGKYVSSWRDTMNTAAMIAYGECDGTGTRTTYMATMTDPVSGQEVKIKQVVTWLDDDTMKAEAWNSMGGETFKSMEFMARRKK